MTNIILKKLRTIRGLTQSECAEQIGVNISSYQKYEKTSNPIMPTLEILIKIADFYNVSLDYLVGRNTPEVNSLDGMAFESNLNRVERAVIEAFITADTDGRASIIDFAKKVAKAEAEARENFIIQDMTAEEYEREVMSRVNADAEKEEKASG